MTFAHLDDVIETVEPLASAFAAAGHRLYLVGGIVRDQWLDEALDASSDIDLTTDATPAVIKELVGDLADALWTQGERFGTIGLRHRGRAIEITTHRAESYDADSRKPEVVFGDDIAVDLSRRDFTVNAMAVEVPSGELVDPWGGATDLAAARLRTPLSPEVSFSDDPLRMLRAARFGAKYRLEPAAELVSAATELRERLRIVAIERIGDELQRLFGLESAAVGVRFLVETGLAHELLLWKRPAAPAPAETTLAAAAEKVAAVSSLDWRSRLAAFMLASWELPDRAAESVAGLRLAGDDRRFIDAVMRSAHAIQQIERPDPRSLRGWTSQAQHTEVAIAVAKAVYPGPRTDDFAAALAALHAVEDPAELVTLDGEEIMELLNITAGPAIGEAIAKLRGALIDQGPLSTAAQKALVEQWWSERNNR